ncbi:MAG: bifunctional diaminohydroxyphosphoribosylaminopyrimidine deaminase/5-amino-6-(5-phosphoribosylamino)uracil reductase RibD [Flavobacteriales bacterium]|nr:bifunctional diaminohydroxyphosphoribosylaminopyrimidine deaminase/5-amino-6-(5-phosphoribosylamino)uracil reductase RibD [Flavobacteriales bacterium]MBK6752270.1 bifunctional diaminohydroxyphosphoribosylaminopyrimidine deaminase/5-amino-6-(5-phosphoribosylamino)uracil reductase RibD [Flavobacteriales bacterium]MBK9537778.1 bifunctional diaminohydroxyphosphoribosylaminopyrimidine deaminase/5-amino-6-(5-phosphoribosylamino)uracil reductase RibD [Flavobacteriales bacterium]
MDGATWMHRCLRLAALGSGSAAPNPMVGAVLVQQDRILAEGWHRASGGPHAEVECLRAFGDGSVPDDAVLFVNLEPCTHHGRTPPCVDLLLERGVKHVVIAQLDPFPEVNGRGIERLRQAGVTVSLGIEEAQARWLNRRFLGSVGAGRPYIVLKWARSQDGFLDRHPRSSRVVQRISSPDTDVLVHRWRTEEQAILVGSRTVLNDDPQLTARLCSGRQPLRVVLDRKGITPPGSMVYSNAAPSLLFTHEVRADVLVEQVTLPMASDPLPGMMDELHRRGIRSVLVEGGAELLGHFVRSGLWDEARVITGEMLCAQGTAAPVLPGSPHRSWLSGNDRIDLHINHRPISKLGMIPDPTWPW